MWRTMAVTAVMLVAAAAYAQMQPLGVTVPEPALGSWSTLLATDVLGRLYACDGETIYRLSGGTFAGLYSGLTADAGASIDPSGFAVSSSGTLAYVATGFTGRIVEVDLAAGSARELSGARLAGGTGGVTLDPIYDRVFLTGGAMQKLYRLDPAGAGNLTLISDFANQGWSDAGLSFAPGGDLTVPVNRGWADWPAEDNFPVDLFRFDRATILNELVGGQPVNNPPTLVAQGIMVSGNMSVAADGDGNTYFSALDAIYKIDATGNLSTLVGDPSQNAFMMFGVGYMGLAYDATGNRLLFAYRESSNQPYQLYQYVLPEPGTLVIAACGLILASWRRIRRD